MKSCLRNFFLIVIGAIQHSHNLSLNGVQAIASAELSSKNTKIWKAIFDFLLLILEADHRFHNLSYTHTNCIFQTNPLKNPRIDFLDHFFFRGAGDLVINFKCGFHIGMPDTIHNRRIFFF